MVVEKVAYRNFRSVKDEVFLPDERINILYGKNAGGKTTFLEGIYLFARGKSMRTVHDTELISFGEDYSAVELSFRNSERGYKMRMAYDTRGRKRFDRNGVQIKLLSEYIGLFRAVLFAPEHLSIVTEGPGIRRNFLNAAISQLDTSYIVDLQRLNYAVRERNALLKRYDKSDFYSLGPVYAEQIAEHSGRIAEKRKKYIKSLSEKAGVIMGEMSGGREELSFKYVGEDNPEIILKNLTDNSDREIKAGMTLFGAHRDEMEIFINGKNAKAFASQGQKRSISLAMKLSEGEISKDQTNEYPVYLFDDVFSELDRDRREYLLSEIEGRQVFITTCEERETEQNRYPVFNVINGKIIN